MVTDNEFEVVVQNGVVVHISNSYIITPVVKNNKTQTNIDKKGEKHE